MGRGQSDSILFGDVEPVATRSASASLSNPNATQQASPPSKKKLGSSIPNVVQIGSLTPDPIYSNDVYDGHGLAGEHVGPGKIRELEFEDGTLRACLTANDELVITLACERRGRPAGLFRRADPALGWDSYELYRGKSASEASAAARAAVTHEYDCTGPYRFYRDALIKETGRAIDKRNSAAAVTAASGITR